MEGQMVNVLDEKNDENDPYIDNMDNYLLQQLKSRDMLSEYSIYFNYA